MLVQQKEKKKEKTNVWLKHEFGFWLNQHQSDQCLMEKRTGGLCFAGMSSLVVGVLRSTRLSDTLELFMLYELNNESEAETKSR